jgi:hypothetical protein
MAPKVCSKRTFLVCQKLAGYLGLRHLVERRSDRRQGRRGDSARRAFDTLRLQLLGLTPQLDAWAALCEEQSRPSLNSRCPSAQETLADMVETISPV